MDDVDVYPVGLLMDLRHVRTSIRLRRWQRARYRLRTIAANLRSGRRSYLNGYLAEPRHLDGTWTRCGHGWTPTRALRDLNRHREAVATQSTGSRR
jgi:hypothetical protein